ncbi:LITAF domain-containing protein [Heracleum sosnowskyi]|uniref:LITAF domain-containing protein n=1 Tax=Heracleum sosnowskyi TaxID=360622 RepID=A0AAD8MKB4_9APIA|nr:LITAF domain-containing protein [Heracleum sosnowskyi]
MGQEKMGEAVMGIPAYQQQQAGGGGYYVAQNEQVYNSRFPANAIFGDPKGIPIQQTIFRDTPAPFQCPYCTNSDLTTVRSKPSLAAAVACMMPFMLGVCFLCPCMDCLWHKYHYCPTCNQKVADFQKTDPCIVMDPPHWTQTSYALPA